MFTNNNDGTETFGAIFLTRQELLVYSCQIEIIATGGIVTGRLGTNPQLSSAGLSSMQWSPKVMTYGFNLFQFYRNKEGCNNGLLPMVCSSLSKVLDD